MQLLRVATCALALTVCTAAAQAPPPSRAAGEGCHWQQRNDVAIGLRSWVQHCDYGFRKIDFLIVGQSLAERYSDGDGKPEAVVDVLDLIGDETPEQGLKRLYAARTGSSVATRCELTPWRGEWPKSPTTVKRYSFTPNAVYAKELAKTQDPNEISLPACGAFGAADDTVRYFEVHPASNARRVLFVRVGQDDPLFDDATLVLLPAAKTVPPQPANKVD